MQKRHDNLLTSRLERVENGGVSHILWNELYSWYDVQKIAARTLRDLSQRWDEITDGDKGRLMKIEGEGGLFLVGENEVKPVHEEKLSDEE